MKRLRRMVHVIVAVVVSGGAVEAQNAVPVEPEIRAGVDFDFARIEMTPMDDDDSRDKRLRKRRNFQERMDCHLDVFLDWIVDVCGLNEQQRGEAAKLARDFGVTSPAARVAREMSDGEPQNTPTFAHRASLATLARLQLSQEMRHSVLTVDQSTRLDAALRERTAGHRRAYRDLAIATLDRELFFTGEQRAALLEQLPAESSRYDAPPPDSTIYLYDPPCLALELPESCLKCLSSEQVEAWRNIFQQQGKLSRLRIRLGPPQIGGRDEFLKLQKRSQDALMRYAELQIAYYRHEALLNPEQVQTLRLAAKKLAVESVEKWQVGDFQDPLMNGQQQAAGNRIKLEYEVIEDAFGAFLNGKSREDLLQSYPGWQQALQEALINAPREGMKAREQFQRNARTEAVLSMLDEEFWLRREQRSLMRELVSGSLPESLTSYSIYSHARDQAWCAFAIQSQGAEPPAFLNEKQKAVWQLLKKSYNPEDDPRKYLGNQAQQINVAEEPDLPRPFNLDGLQIPQPVPQENNAPRRSMIEIREE